MTTCPSFVYTLVAYRANGVDTCRNCVMGQSDSDFELSVFTSASELAAHWAKHRFNSPRGREFCHYDYTLLLNGRDEYNDLEGEGEDQRDPESWDTWAEIERRKVKTLLDAELAKLEAARKAEEERKAAVAETARLAKVRATEVAREARDRAEYERLQAKFRPQ